MTSSSSSSFIPMKGIRFIHYVDPAMIDQMCKEFDFVEVSFNAYDNEKYSDGTVYREQKAGLGAQIKSSKDVVQFDHEDMKLLTAKIKKELR